MFGRNVRSLFKVEFQKGHHDSHVELKVIGPVVFTSWTAISDEIERVDKKKFRLDFSEAILFSFVSMMLVIYSGTRGFLDPGTFRLFLWVMMAGALLWISGKEKLKFLAWLVFAGFPISPFFLGEELLLQHLGDEGFFALTLFFGTFILNGLVLIRSFLQETWLAHARPLD